jgi:hypothetical protein
VSLIQAVLISSYPPSAGLKAGLYCIIFIVLCGGVCAQDGKAGYEHGTKNYFCKIFQLILEFQKHFHCTEANAVKLSTFQCPQNLRNTFFQI